MNKGESMADNRFRAAEIAVLAFVMIKVMRLVQWWIRRAEAKQALAAGVGR
jgi:hypothetical protein